MKCLILSVQLDAVSPVCTCSGPPPKFEIWNILGTLEVSLLPFLTQYPFPRSNHRPDFCHHRLVFSVYSYFSGFFMQCFICEIHLFYCIWDVIFKKISQNNYSNVYLHLKWSSWEAVDSGLVCGKVLGCLETQSRIFTASGQGSHTHQQEGFRATSSFWLHPKLDHPLFFNRFISKKLAE